MIVLLKKHYNFLCFWFVIHGPSSVDSALLHQLIKIQRGKKASLVGCKISYHIVDLLVSHVGVEHVTGCVESPGRKERKSLWARFARILVLFLFVIHLQFFVCGTLIFFYYIWYWHPYRTSKRDTLSLHFHLMICPFVTGIVFRQIHCAQSTLVSRSLCM